MPPVERGFAIFSGDCSPNARRCSQLAREKCPGGDRHRYGMRFGTLVKAAFHRNWDFPAPLADRGCTVATLDFSEALLVMK